MIRYQPVRFPLVEMTRDLDQLFDRIFADATPAARSTRVAGVQPGAANLFETSEAYLVELPLPGVKPEDVEVTVQENILTLAAKRSWQAPENAKAVWQGFSAGEWKQRFTLPGEVNSDRVSATLELGVLRLELPKAEHMKPRTIRINGAAIDAGKQIEQPADAQSATEQPAT